MYQLINFRQLTAWLPSIWVAFFFIDNAFHKITAPAAELKPGISEAGVVMVGLVLLLFVTLFLRAKTMVWGAMLLASYMSIVLGLHIVKEKPILLTAGVVVLILAAALVRSPNWLSKPN